jgi:hypothetical protein
MKAGLHKIRVRIGVVNTPAKPDRPVYGKILNKYLILYSETDV